MYVSNNAKTVEKADKLHFWSRALNVNNGFGDMDAA